MQVDGFNKSIYHRFKPSELTPGLPLIVYKLLLKINSPTEKILEKEFTDGTLQSERQEKHLALVSHNYDVQSKCDEKKNIQMAAW